MSALFTPATKPSSRLSRYRVLSPYASIHVSPIQLGAMNIGDKWEQFGMGGMSREPSFKLLDAFYEAGGNFIGTANMYQDQSSEEFIGEWVESRGIRDQLVIATKYTSNYVRRGTDIKQQVLYVGNSVKSVYISVEARLKKLRTFSYIDILYIHWWDWDTSIEEIMNGLHVLVRQGKALYLGISDTPAWVVAQANQYARDHGKTSFVIYQAHGMALAPWGALAGGKLRSEEEERRLQSGGKGRIVFSPEWQRNETKRAVSRALEKVAKEVGSKHITAVAIANVEHLEANLEALEIVLTPEHIKYLESIAAFDPGFPITMIGDGSDYTILMKNAAYIEKQPALRAIVPDIS